MDDLMTWLWSKGGVVMTRDLEDAGFTGHRIAQLVRAGVVTRPRRGWIAAIGADPDLVGAAAAGVIPTCVTRAERLGLWTYRDDDPHRHHVAAPPHSGSVSAKNSRIHWSKPLIARTRGQLVDPIENVLALVTECQPHEHALAIWESAFNKKLVDRDAFGRYDLRPAARRLLSEATPFSDSGLETFVLTRLRWLPVRVVPQVWLHGHVVDFLIGDRLVLQVDGGTHVGAQRDEDNAHDLILRLHGFTVIRIGYRQVVDEWPQVQEQILRAIAQGLHKAR